MNTLSTIIVTALLVGDVFAFDASQKQIEIANSVIPDMIAAGLVRVDKPAAKAWVSEMTWAQFDAQGKENLATALAIYCDPKSPVISIYGMQSARHLAEWGWAKGLEVF